MPVMRFEQTFHVGAAPEAVFDFMVEPANLAKWQTVKTYVTPLDEGPPRQGYRVKEGTKVGPRKWDQVVEFTEFERGRVLHVTVIDGPPSNGRWTLEPDGDGTRVHLDAEMDAPPLIGPLIRIATARQFRGFHENLRREVESLGEVAGGDS